MGPTKEPPPPPPLPLPVARNPQQKQSNYLARIEAPGPSSTEKTVKRHTESKSHCPVVYFFYGTLTKPEILKHVLDSKEEPDLKPATISGYSLASWGQYLALVDGDPGDEVKGCAFEVKSVEDESKLQQYETSAYKINSCWIDFAEGSVENPKRAWGKTFVYAGDSAALKAGRFDRTLWELQMGMRLPNTWRKPPLSSGTASDEAETPSAMH